MNQVSKGNKSGRPFLKVALLCGSVIFAGSSCYNFVADDMPATPAGYERAAMIGVADTAGAAAGFAVFGWIGAAIGFGGVQEALDKTVTKKPLPQTSPKPLPQASAQRTPKP